MKRKVILTVAIFFYFAPTFFSQSNYSISAGLGIIQSYSTAEGIDLGIKRVIDDNLRFQLTTGFYYWGKKQDLNAIVFFQEFMLLM